MSANVYYTLANALVYTDKLKISSDEPFTYQVFATALGTANAVGNIFSQPVGYPSGVFEVYSGAGNRVTVVGVGNISALELGTASSAQAGVIAG
jgi:hypothetical protein